MYNDRTILLPNFKAVGQTPAELNILKVKKLDACIRSRPLFINLVTIVSTNLDGFNLANHGPFAKLSCYTVQ